MVIRRYGRSALRRSLPQHLGSPLVDALAPNVGGRGDRGMDLRRNAQHQPAGIRLPGGPALLLADRDVDGFTKGIFKLVNRRPVKPDDVLDASQMADEYAVDLVELDPGGVAPILHLVHGLTPAHSRNARASLTR